MCRCNCNKKNLSEESVIMFIQQGQKFSNGLNRFLCSPIQHNSSNIVFGPTTLVFDIF